MYLRVLSSLGLKASKDEDEDCTASLVHLFQYSGLLTMKLFLLTENLNLFCSTLHPLLLPLFTTVFDSVFSVITM